MCAINNNMNVNLVDVQLILTELEYGLPRAFVMAAVRWLSVVSLVTHKKQSTNTLKTSFILDMRQSEELLTALVG